MCRVYGVKSFSRNIRVIYFLSYYLYHVLHMMDAPNRFVFIPKFQSEFFDTQELCIKSLITCLRGSNSLIFESLHCSVIL